MQLADIRLRITPEGADRAVLCGASRMGKSTAAGLLVDLFYRDYVESLSVKNTYFSRVAGNAPKGRILIVDTKPRWRPDMLADGSKAKKRYTKFLPGNVIPHSRLVSDNGEWDLAWETGEGVVLLQNHEMPQNELVQWCVEKMQQFFKSQTYRRPGLIVIDEGMDFFGPTGNGRYGDIVQRVVRAGGEKGLASLVLVQRPKTINLQVLTESNYLMLFHIRFNEDMNRLREMGIPRDFRNPSQRHHFALWRDDMVVTRDAVLAL